METSDRPSKDGNTAIEGSSGKTLQEVKTTASYAGKKFHLFQVVKITPDPIPDEWPRTWIVVDLNGGITVASTSFDKRKTYHPESDGFDALRPVTEGRIPVFGY